MGMYLRIWQRPVLSGGPFQGTYGGKGFEESGEKSWALTDQWWGRCFKMAGRVRNCGILFGRAYCDGLQTTATSQTGWGKESVCTMSKHWPGGGPCEGGRDAHYPFGKYAVYPGENLEDHLKPFLEGVFQLEGPTKQTAAVMPYYTVSWNVDSKEPKMLIILIAGIL